jgi:hypothetical protein
LNSGPFITSQGPRMGYKSESSPLGWRVQFCYTPYPSPTGRTCSRRIILPQNLRKKVAFYMHFTCSVYNLPLLCPAPPRPSLSPSLLPPLPFFPFSLSPAP